MKRALRIAAVFLSFVSAYGQKAKPANDHFPLIQVNINGSQRYSKQALIAALGLKVGSQTTQKDLEAASKRLADSGLFSLVQFRFGWAGNGVVGTYDLTDNPVQIPVGFDNFVWFTPNELLTAIKQKVPLFTGVVPLSGDHRDQVRDALQQILVEKNIKGDVSVIPRGSMNAPPTSMQFRVDGHDIKIISCDFPGAANANPTALGELSKYIINSGYEKSSVEASIPGRLKDIYDAQGYLAERSDTPEMKVISTSPEQTQIALTTKVTEGPQYKFSGVEWEGNSAFRSDELTKALGFENGQVASVPKFQQSLRNVRRLYGRVGYLGVKFDPRPSLADNNTAKFAVEVREGTQYRLARARFIGVPTAVADKIVNTWALKEGAVYDDNYPRNFMLAEFSKFMPQGFHSEFRIQEVIHDDVKTVDLNIYVQPKNN